MRDAIEKPAFQDVKVLFFLGLGVLLVLGAAVPVEAGPPSWIDILQPIEDSFSVGVFNRADLEPVAEDARLHGGVAATVLAVGIIEVRVASGGESEALKSFLMTDERIAWLVPLYQIDSETIWVTNSFIVTLRENVSIEDLTELQARVEAIAANSAQLHSNSYVVELPRSRSLNVLAALQIFLEDQQVLLGEPVYFSRGLSSVPNDPLFPKQWALKNNGNNIGETTVQGVAGADLDAELAWDITTGTASVKLAIVDTGVDHQHQDLFLNLDAGADFAVGCPSALPPGNAYCGTGFHGHGTNCAGVAAAIQNDGYGITGIAPGVRIIPVRVGCDQYPNNLWKAQGVSWAWDQGGADVISLSWGTRQTSAIPTSILAEIETAATEGRQGRGAVVVAATGNDGDRFMDFEAATPGSIAVGASNPCDQVMFYENFPTQNCDGSYWGGNYGPRLDVVAPGSFAYSTDNVEVPPDQCGYDPDAHNENWGGTSAATPFVAGVAALLLSIDDTLPTDGVRGFLADTAEQLKIWDINSTSWTQVPDGTFHEQSGWGRINAYRALLAVSNRDPNLVHVNAANSNAENPNQVKETGTSQANGFNTLREGILVLADGGQLVLGAGEYHANELSTPMTLTATGGSAVISALP